MDATPARCEKVENCMTTARAEDDVATSASPQGDGGCLPILLKTEKPEVEVMGGCTGELR